MEIIPQIMAGVVVVGGAGSFVYYSVGKSGGTSIEEHIKSKNRSLISEESDWKDKEIIYKKLDEKSDEIISGVENKDSQITKVWMKIRNWCGKTKSKVFINYDDKMYQSFSQWCLKNIDIQAQLKQEGLKDLSSDDGEMKKRVEEFNDPEKNLDSKFIVGTGENIEKSSKKKVTEEDLKKWCSEKKVITFKHERDQDYSRVKRWCFGRQEQSKKKD
ncbi:hypothetical protein HF1_13940 [Mycoplasma haemofelis str. Langford 1]|uniref:Uncharacterized protein n=1 Tax=Mycoplasma haemofelis (strain Langford 1) TaxID=941640 RepID=E8ZJT1_MYCHL|nr:hypothetical protein [Mycoplasma haemofelis]CBY93402.1 hypothetical protein HF1_13940 [Mycoplasma haemofelis str. Langford 1]